MMKSLFDFEKMRTLTQRKDFWMLFDGMNGIAGPYAKAILGEELGVGESQLINCEVKPDFGGLHPDPNLTYAKQLATDMDIA